MKIKKLNFFALLFFFCCCSAYAKQVTSDYDYVMQQISKKNYDSLDYSPSKKTAIIIHDAEWTKENGSIATYINFKTYEVLDIIKNPGLSIASGWLSENVATIDGSCGTGCRRELIFVVPQTTFACPFSPDFVTKEDGYTSHITSNAPVVIDVKRDLYVCYNYAGKLEIHRLSAIPKPLKIIEPPTDISIDDAKITGNDLTITFHNKRDEKLTKTYDISSADKPEK